MKIHSNDDPLCFQQPVRGYIGREVKDTLEKVDYVPEAHVRIWRNTQLDGYDLHFHSAVEVIIGVENTYHVSTGSQEYLINAGDILIIPPNISHSISSHEQGTRFICLFDIEFITSLYDYKALSPVFLSPYLCSSREYPILHEKIHSSFMKIIDAYFSNKIMWEFAIYSELLHVLVDIGTHHYETAMSDVHSYEKRSTENYDKLANLMHYIDLHYSEELSLEQAADIVGFSKFHFSRIFKDYTNNTFYDYLTRKRIQEAQKLLATDMSVTEICFKTGFNNPTSFCRSFKKYTLFSPSEYRSLIKEENLSEHCDNIQTKQ